VLAGTVETRPQIGLAQRSVHSLTFIHLGPETKSFDAGTCMSLIGKWLHAIRQWWWIPLQILFVEAKGDPELLVWSYPASDFQRPVLRNILLFHIMPTVQRGSQHAGVRRWRQMYTVPTLAPTSMGIISRYRDVFGRNEMTCRSYRVVSHKSSASLRPL
jgi:hypothetical protein